MNTNGGESFSIWSEKWNFALLKEGGGGRPGRLWLCQGSNKSYCLRSGAGAGVDTFYDSWDFINLGGWRYYLHFWLDEVWIWRKFSERLASYLVGCELVVFAQSFLFGKVIKYKSDQIPVILNLMLAFATQINFILCFILFPNNNQSSLLFL